MKVVKNNQKSLDSELEKLKAEKIRQYEFYAEGVINKDQYIRKKKELCGLIDEIEADRKAQTKEFDHQTELWESATELNTLTRSFAGEEKLSRKMVLAFIDNVYIYDSKRIEVVFRYEDEIEKLIKSLE